MSKHGKPFLQSWAIVENPSDEDWNGVKMALISGRPVSFQMDLYQPLYVPRPMVEMELFASLRPPTYDGAVVDHKTRELARPGLAGDRPQARLEALSELGDDKGEGREKDSLRRDEALKRSVRALTDGKHAEEFAMQLGKRMDLGSGVQSAATASQLGDFFQYVLDQPVTLPRQKSALLPIVNKEVDGTRLSIYNPAVHPKFPMLGLKLKNSSGLHLMQGPITVFEGSVYAGDARIQDLPPNDDRLISYAVDLGTEVEAKSHRPADRLTAVRIERGILIRTDKIREERTYTATNRSGQERTVWVEHPYRAEFSLVSETKPVERTQEQYRFELKLPAEAKASASTTVVEERDLATSISLSNLNDQGMRFFLNNAISSPKVKEALQQAMDLKGKLVRTQQELGQVNQQLQQITKDQERLRANLREMPQTAAAYKRYLAKFDQQETEIEDLQKKQKQLQAAELRSRQEFEGFLSNLNVK